MVGLTKSQALEIWLKENHPEIFDDYIDDDEILTLNDFVWCFYSDIYKEFESEFSSK